MEAGIDPFFWDVAQVIEALTRPGSPWEKEPESITEKIKSEEFDGETLLTFEQASPQDQLCVYLGIRNARKKIWLQKELVRLRAESEQYRKWARNFKQQKAIGEGTLDSPELKAEGAWQTLGQMKNGGGRSESPLSLGPLEFANGSAILPTSTSGLTPQVHDVEMQGAHAAVAGLSVLPAADALPTDRTNGHMPNGSTRVAEVTTENGADQVLLRQAENPLASGSAPPTRNVGVEQSLPQPAESIPPAQTTDTGDEPHRKKKKLAPTNVSSVPIHKASADSQPWEVSSPRAYIGKGFLTPYMIKSSFVPVSTRLLSGPEGWFAVERNNRLPPGRRITVNRIMKQTMRKNSRKEEQLRQGVPVSRESTPSEDEDEEICDLENLPDLDEATLKEIEDEKKSTEQAQKRLGHMPPDQVQSTLDGAIELISQSWRETKLPKYERKAYKHWQDARKRHNSLRQRIETCQLQAAYYDQRVKKLSEEVCRGEWSKEEDIVKQARSLEQSLHDKLYNSWLAGMLGSVHPPARPSALPRPDPQSRPQQLDPTEDEEEEVLCSTDDGSDDENDFIVSDNEGSAGGLEVQENDVVIPQEPVTPVKTEKFPKFFGGQSGMTPGSRMQTFIDLTTPTKSSQPSPAPGRGGLELPDPPSVGVIDMDAISRFTKAHWRRDDDRWRLAIFILLELSFDQRAAVLDLIRDKSDHHVWETFIVAFLSRDAMTCEQVEVSPQLLREYHLSRIFLSFIKCKIISKKRLLSLNEKDKKTLRNASPTFQPFCKFIRSILPLFPKESQIYRRGDIDGEAGEMLEELGPLEDAGPDPQTPSRARKSGAREIVRNKDAVDLRERQNEMLQAQEERRNRLRNDLAKSKTMSRDKTRLIINETKGENQSFIYFNDFVGSRIKDHQIEGVRFLWNQIIQDPSIRQGCLLAHTMGLGKTMQVITFLVAIAEAAASPDETIRSQIPDDLRTSQTLILCPAGLVNNWVDELLMWAPDKLLGPLTKIDAIMPERERKPTVENWAANGGILVVGYEMFRGMHESSSELESILDSTPNVVVADEAHKLKNPEAQTSKACSQFRTTSRIALTGSPLANNVEEYYEMINWVAPNFLGPRSEFRDIYGRDIDIGLYKDSSAGEKRRAMKMLQVLKETVAPKVHRATIKSCLANDFPPKTEYVISVTPTALQRRLYDMYIEAQNVWSDDPKKIFAVTDQLLLICNHPRCLREKALEVRRKSTNRTVAEDDADSSGVFPKTAISQFLKETAVGDRDNPALSMKVALLNIILDEAKRQGDKVLIFSQSILTLNYLGNIFTLARRRYNRLDGSTKPRDRQGDTKAFNEGDKEVYLISTKAGGVGLNIHGANRVVLFDTMWNPVDNQQAVGRAYRLGQTKKVFVYHFLVAGTFEDDMQNRAVFKQQLAHRVVDKKNPINWSTRHTELKHPIRDVERKSLAEFEGQDVILDRLIKHRVASVPDEQPVLKIVSADTFEEEDTTVVLSEAERKEANEMVTMNRLRQTDPNEYERRRTQQQYPASAGAGLSHPSAYSSQPWSGQTSTQAQGQHAFRASISQSQAYQPAGAQPQAGASAYSSTQPVGDAGNGPAFSPYTNQPSAQQGQAGQANGHALPPQVNTPSPMVGGPTQSGKPTPMPIFGANTFLGKPQAPPPSSAPSRVTTPSQFSQGPQGASLPSDLFGQPRTSDKDAFQDGLVAAANSLHAQGKYPQVAPSAVAESVCNSINNYRINAGYGFLPDNQHWRQLKVLLASERFVMATMSGNLSTKFLALAAKSELERRVNTLNKLSEAEFTDSMARSREMPDPQNLQNIGRGLSHRDPEGMVGKDLKIMREAADNRRHRPPQ